MRTIKDITGQKFGKLTALYPLEKRNSSGNAIWRCKCECGGTRDAIASYLINGSTIGCKDCQTTRGRKFKDITGQQFNYLTVLYKTNKKDSRNSRIWHCRCVCGKEVDIPGDRLRSGQAKSCGCKNLRKSCSMGSTHAIKNSTDLTGQKFGKLTVIGRSANKHRKGRYWTCKCECGKVKVYDTNTLIHKTSCGCDKKRKSYKMRTFDSVSVGDRFGKLTTVYYLPSKPGHWICKCDCGNLAIIRTNDLKKGTTQSCGCRKIKNPDKLPYCKKLLDAKTDLTGMRFGKLTVIKDTGKSSGKGKLWLCKCDCGNTKEVSDSALRFNMTKTCGCTKYNGKDLTGQRFGRLTVLEKTNKRCHGYIVWKCKCDCGNIVEIPMHNLSYNNSTRSCGCLLKETKATWGQRVKDNYKKWKKL